MAAGKMRAAPHECIVVEDSPAGVTAAVAAGMTAIGFVGGSHAADDLAAQLAAAEGATIDHRRHARAQERGIELRGW